MTPSVRLALVPVALILWVATAGAEGASPPEEAEPPGSAGEEAEPARPAEAANPSADRFDASLAELHAALEASAGADEVTRAEAEVIAAVAEEMHVEGDTDVALRLLEEALALVLPGGA